MSEIYIVLLLFAILLISNAIAIRLFISDKKRNKIRESRLRVISSNEVIVEYDSPASILAKEKKTHVFYKILKLVVEIDLNSTLYSRKDISKVCVGCFFAVISIAVILSLFLNKFVVEISPIFTIVLIRFYFMRLKNKYHVKLTEQLPETVFMMSRCLKVGVSLSRTLEIISNQTAEPTKKLFEDVVHKVAVGKELGEALEELASNGGIKEYKFFSIIVKLQTNTGGGLAEILDSFASTIRKRTQARKKAIALASEARTSCYVLAGLPVFMAALMSFMNPKYIQILYVTPSGLKMLYTAIFLFFMGILSMVFITKALLR